MSCFIYYYAECHYAESHYAESHYAESHYAESHYAEFHYAECHYAEFHYAECRSASECTVQAISCFSQPMKSLSLKERGGAMLCTTTWALKYISYQPQCFNK
jgi:hypothetical protein